MVYIFLSSNNPMAFDYNFKNKEANFGPPIEKPVEGGTHITFEILMKKNNKFIALRRPKGIPNHELPPKAKDHPNGLLYFCHGLIRYGETVEDCINRIVNEQAGVSVKDFEVSYIDSSVQEKDNQWAFIPHIIAEVDEIPKTNEDVTEVVEFDKDNIPEDFGWWTKEDLEEFLE